MKKFLGILALLFGTTAFAAPTTVEEFRNVTVQVTNAEESSGGSGTIIKSTSSGSLVLTNRHVCELTAEGGYVITTKGKYAVQKIQKAENHDLCLVYVTVNLGVNATVAKETPQPGDPIRVSGHPFLLPHMLVEGHLSSAMQVTILTDVVKCTEADYKEAEDLCYWFGGVPVVREYNATTTSALIAPGNSGSAVYNADGEIVALVFAGTGRGMSPGILVPHEYIVGFLKDAGKGKWTNVSQGKKLTDLMSKTKSNSKARTLRIDLKDIVNVDILPASKDIKFDRLYNKIVECKGNLKSCLRNQ